MQVLPQVQLIVADLQQLMDFRHPLSPFLPLLQLRLEGFDQTPDVLHRQVTGPMPLQHLGDNASSEGSVAR
jgi:hypothetical protein